MKVYAFEWQYCIYESGFDVQSLHRTKRGAFKAMTACANFMWHEDRRSRLQYGNDRQFSPLCHQRWRVRTIELKE